MLKKFNTLCLCLFLIGSSVLFHGHSQGMDTDLYTVTTNDVPPNVLIILDNSSSMANEDQLPNYNPNRTDYCENYQDFRQVLKNKGILHE